MTRPRTLALAAGAAFVLLLAAAGHGSGARAQEEALPPCAPPAFQAQLMTPLTGTVPRDGGLVVGLFPGGTLTELPALALRQRRRTVPLRAEAIAPGLYRARPETPRLSGRFTLDGVAGAPELVFGRGRLPPPPARPRVDGLERYLVAAVGEPRVELRARLGFPIPAGVVAIVAYFGDDETPDLFARGVPQQTDALLFAGTARCPALPAGASPPPAEGAVRIAFVDALGQLSQISEPQLLAP